MNWVDLIVFTVLGVSALLAFMRGLVREVLAIAAWVGAGFFAAWAFPYVRNSFHGWTGTSDIGNPLAFGSMFIIGVIFLSVISGVIGGMVRTSLFNGLDRTLGVVFGLLRGAALVVFAYIAGGIAMPVENWPAVVLDARTLPFAYRGAAFAVAVLPQEYRPSLHAPPVGRETSADDLLRATPQGRAIPKP